MEEKEFYPLKRRISNMSFNIVSYGLEKKLTCLQNLNKQ